MSISVLGRRIARLAFLLLLSARAWGQGAETLGWRFIGPMASDARIVALSHSRPSTLYTASSVLYVGFVFRSDDGGQSWSVTNTDRNLGFIRCLEADPRDPEVVYAGTSRNYRLDVGNSGVFKSVEAAGPGSC